MDISLISLENGVECYLFCPKRAKANFVPCVIDVPLQHLLNQVVCIDSEPMALAHHKTSNILTEGESCLHSNPVSFSISRERERERTKCMSFFHNIQNLKLKIILKFLTKKKLYIKRNRLNVQNMSLLHNFQNNKLMRTK